MTLIKQLRIDKLYRLGLHFNGESFIKDDINIHHTELLCTTDEEFNKIYDSVSNEIDRREQTSPEQSDNVSCKVCNKPIPKHSIYLIDECCSQYCYSFTFTILYKGH